MAFEWYVGLRYLKARSREAFVSLISLLSLSGVTLGVTALIVVIAVMSGAEADLRRRILSVQPHIMVMQHGGAMPAFARVKERLLEIGSVDRASAFIFSQIMIRARGGMAAAVLKGIDPSADATIIGPELAAVLRHSAESATAAGDRRPAGIVIGRVMAENLGIQIGDTVYAMVVEGLRQAGGRLPGTQRLIVLGLFDSGLYEYDKSYACMHLREAQRLLHMPGSATGIELRIGDPFQAPEVTAQIARDLGFPFWARDWISLNRNLFASLRLQKTVMFIILILIVLVAAFSITSMLVMRVKQKTGEIAILKALGATPARIRRIFIVNGMLVSGIGTLLGTLLGVVICGILKRYSFIELPADVYYFTRLPVQLAWLDVLAINAATLLISLLATVLPARRAAALPPVRGLRGL